MRRSSILAGLILIAVGLLFLLLPLFPNVSDFLDINQQWPLIIVLIGGFFIIGALLGSPGLAVPGTVIGSIGLMMYYQNLNNAWETWSYSWTLITVFVGIGIFIMRLLQGEASAGLREGGRLVIIGLIMFLIFGSFMGAGLRSTLILSVMLIGVGIWIVIRVILRARRSESS